MKLFSGEAKYLCSVEDGAEEDDLVKIFVREQSKHGGAGILQLVADTETMIVKHVRPQSNEAGNMEILRKMIPKEHLPQTRRVLQGQWLVLERVPPVFASMSSFKDLLCHSRTVPLDVVQTCVAQLVALLCTAQECDPTFAHNDLKADNILLRAETREDPLTIGRFSVKHVGVRVVLIDMETVTGTRFPLVELPKVPREKLELFGLDASMPWCCWTDFHLVCMEIWKTVRLQRPKWYASCVDFFQVAAPTPRVFSTFDEGNIHFVTSMNRLSTKGRLTVNALMDAGSMKRLEDLYTLPFLSPWMERKEGLDHSPVLLQESDTPTATKQPSPSNSPAENDTS